MKGRRQSAAWVDRQKRHDYWGVNIDAPDPGALARFYARLLDWEISYEEEDDVAIQPPDGVAYVAFQRSVDYERPSWPPTAGSQQMMMHLDIEVEELEAAVTEAVAAGAELASYQPQEHVRVLLDPAGHPFCLYTGVGN